MGRARVDLAFCAFWAHNVVSDQKRRPLLKQWIALHYSQTDLYSVTHARGWCALSLPNFWMDSKAHVECKSGTARWTATIERFLKLVLHAISHSLSNSQCSSLPFEQCVYSMRCCYPSSSCSRQTPYCYMLNAIGDDGTNNDIGKVLRLDTAAVDGGEERGFDKIIS